MKRRWSVILVTSVALLAVAGIGLQAWRGPSLAAYEIVERPLIQNVVATGRVAAASRVQVGSEVTGIVLERRVREGDRIAAGDVLAVLRADELEAAVRQAEAELAELQESTRPQAQAVLREAEVSLEQAARETARRRELFREGAISREEMERAVQAEAAARASAERASLSARALRSGHPNEEAVRARLANATAQLEKTIIRSEVDGTVLTRNAEPGDLVQPSRVLFEIARDGDTEILVPFDERNLEVLALGQRAVCIADAYPTHQFAATISFIAPSVDPQRGTVDVRLTVRQAPDFLRQDMTVSVNVETGRRDRAIVVPNDALAHVNGDRAEVWLLVDGRSVRRPVRLGLRGLTHAEVTDGLAAGALVLADARAPVEEGDRVRTVLGTPPSDASRSATRNELPIRPGG